MLLGNPHFPWQGSERFYQAQLTIPGKLDVSGAQAVRGPGGADRPHRQPGLEPHGLDRVPLHAVPGDPQPGSTRRSTSTTARSRTWMTDDGPVTVAGPGRRPGRLHARRRRRAELRAHAVLDPPRAGLQQPRRRARSRGRPRRVRDGRRQRAELPLPQPLLRDRPGPERRGARRDPAPKPGHPVGQHDRRGLDRARPTTPTSRSRPHVTDEKARPATRRSATRRSSACACRCSTARARPASGAATPTRSSRAPSARRTCRRCSATTTSPTPTTATGCPTPRSRSRASRGSSATSAPSARCAPAAAW